MNKEQQRLEDARTRKAHWKRWGPYVSEREWGTVREDYSAEGAAWDYLPHDHARSRAYRWGEDGLAGICDRRQLICFAIALWNGHDPILKERLFGLTGSEGNHGEDVKEYYYYLDSTPTHSSMKWLYKYPHAAFPYAQLAEENRRRPRTAPEFELMDTGVFADDRYFDVQVEYAKATPEDILIRITVTNRGPETARLHLLPTIWFRNTWLWGMDARKPKLRLGPKIAGAASIECLQEYYGQRWLLCELPASDAPAEPPELLFTENETNFQRLYGVENLSPYVKDGINDFIVQGRRDKVNPAQTGTKVSAAYVLEVPPSASSVVRLRLTDRLPAVAGGAEPATESAGVSPSRTDLDPFGSRFDEIFEKRIEEADEFYRALAPGDLPDDARNVQRQAFAGMLWSKQFYHLDLNRWLRGDPASPPPPRSRRQGRNREWSHLYNADVLSMPDKWEYPWYAAWDIAFHCISLALVDPDFAKEQLVLLSREWYMHPNGQLPAYEWAFGDVNPPVHAWAAWRVYKIERKMKGRCDRRFLERVFHKLLLNFTWWVNRKDEEGNNVFSGGFLGLDNIGVFDRSAALPTGGHIEQSDGTSWMAMYCLNLLAIALELAREDPAYEDVASKFFEHFVYIARAMNNIGGERIELWDREDGFYYDVLHLGEHQNIPLKVRSMVGLIPLFAVETLDGSVVDRLPGFKRRMQWFIENRPDFAENVDTIATDDLEFRRLLSIPSKEKLTAVLRRMLDENEFLSPYGIRSLSRYHLDHPYRFTVGGEEYRVDYEPAESMTGLFGGNSNWRGPIWFPVNFLIIESLQKFHHFYGDDFKVECPTGSGRMMNLWEVSAELSRRLTMLFLKDSHGLRPAFGGNEKLQSDPLWRDHILFHEYFHGDNGAGIGASHQTGWTGLVAKLIQQSGKTLS